MGWRLGKEFPYSRVGLILTGRYFIYPTAVGTALIGGMSYDRNE